MSPRLSVVIPVFNRPAAVRRAIESVQAQTCQDIEIIVVDDGSTDDTVAAVAALPDPRIVLIRHQKTRGAGAARNTGIKASSAPYVAFLDSDDEWLPTKAERQLQVFQRAGERLALVYTGVERVYADGSVEVDIPKPGVDLSRALLTANVVGETSVGMVRRSVLDEAGGFDESLPASQEMDLWLRICERCDADFVPHALVRVSKGNDRGRISASIGATTRGRELFRSKHREKLIRQRVLHIHLRESGWWYQRGARDLKAARRCYLEAVVANPLALTTYALLLGTCLPQSWQDRMAGWKHQVTAVLRSGARGEVSGSNPAALNPTNGNGRS